MKLRTKLTAAILVAAIFTATAGMAIAVKMTKNSFNEYILGHLSISQELWGDYATAYYRQHQDLQGIQNEIQPSTTRAAGNRGLQKGFAFNEHVLIMDQEGKVVFDNQGTLLGQVAEAKLMSTGTPLVVDGQKIGTLLIRVIPPRGAVTLEEQFLTSVYTGFFWGGLAAALLAALLGYLLSGGLIRPIQRLTQVIVRFSQNNWQQRVEVTTQDEIGALGQAFNSLAEQLEKSVKLKKQLVDDISHELRTPITILRGNLESIQAGVKEPSPQLILSMNDEVIRLSRLISGLQDLSLLDHNDLPIDGTRLDMVVMLEKIRALFLTEAQGKGVQMKLEYKEAPFFLKVDEDKMIQVIINLVSNALRHTPLNSVVTIGLDKEIIEEKQFAALRIMDQGAGIPEPEAENIFERFYRLDEARNREEGGMGLGLAITKGIVEAHGGKIRVAPHELQGAVFTVYLPLD